MYFIICGNGNDSEVERLAVDPSSHARLFCLGLHFFNIFYKLTKMIAVKY